MLNASYDFWFAVNLEIEILAYLGWVSSGRSEASLGPGSAQAWASLAQTRVPKIKNVSQKL